MQLMTSLEGIVDNSFGNQRIVTSQKQDEDGPMQQVESAIADCMQGFHDALVREEENLDSLWQKWSEVQASMICLGVEILGQHNIDLEEHMLSDTLVQEIGKANIKYKENGNCYIAAEQSVLGFETELNTIYNNTSMTMKAQQKASNSL